jgi:hypothetical protein
MSNASQPADPEGSYSLGETDGESWAQSAHPNERQSIAVLTAEDIGQRDVFGQETGTFLAEKASEYARQDKHFHATAYYEGFLSAVRRCRHFNLAFATQRTRR